MQSGHTKMSVRPETREKLERIAQIRRWTYAETLDAIADFYISHDVELAAGEATAEPVNETD